MNNKQAFDISPTREHQFNAHRFIQEHEFDEWFESLPLKFSSIKGNRRDFIKKSLINMGYVFYPLPKISEYCQNLIML